MAAPLLYAHLMEDEKFMSRVFAGLRIIVVLWWLMLFLSMLFTYHC